MEFYNHQKQIVYKRNLKHKRGFTLVELLVAIGLFGAIFVGVIGGIRIALETTYATRAHATATALAQEQIEYMRSLSYEDIGTTAGIPNGVIPQTQERRVNGISFRIENLVRYVDDPADGTGADDDNSVTTDYKEMKVTVHWSGRNKERAVALQSLVTPPGIETTAGGGTLDVKVYNADLSPLAGAAVRIVNNNVSPSIDVSQNTNADGVVRFGGAPAASEYEVFVDRSGYSSAQTHAPSSDLPNPDTQPVTVTEGEVSAVSFQIDRVGTLDLDFSLFVEPLVNEETFDAQTSLTASSSVALTSEGAVLATGMDGYSQTGWFITEPLTPEDLDSWETVEVLQEVPETTNAFYQIMYQTAEGDYQPVPNADLSGNEAGFSTDMISLRSLSTVDYPTLALRVQLETESASSTPKVTASSFAYQTSPVPYTDKNIQVRGNKSIGTDGDGEKVYKYNEVHYTGSSGSLDLNDMEWDTYQVGVPETHAVARSCPSVPFNLLSGASAQLDIELVEHNGNLLRAVIYNEEGSPQPGAVVSLLDVNGVTVAEKTAGACGQVYFNDSSLGGEGYQLRVNAPAYMEMVVDNITIDGVSLETITLSPQ